MKLAKRFSAGAVITASFLFQALAVHADDGAPSFNGGAAQDAVNPYIQGVINFLLWFVPIAFIASSLIAGAKYFFMDDREREQKPITKTIAHLGIAALIIWSAPLIATIIGLTH
jgi:hypothetical protein